MNILHENLFPINFCEKQQFLRQAKIFSLLPFLRMDTEAVIKKVENLDINKHKSGHKFFIIQ